MPSAHDSDAGMPPVRWSEIERLVDQALDMAPDVRRRFLADRCAGDRALLAGVEKLLDACEQAAKDPAFLSKPLVASAASIARDIDAQYAAAEAAIPAALDAALGGHYEVQRLLGRGGMATVYVARDVRHRRDVAIKVLRPDLAREVGAERFLLEIDIAAQLQHANILPVYDSGDADGLLYYIMPFVEGDSLKQLLEREKQLPIRSALAIAQDIGSALDHAHAHGIVHRDIKPANILLDGSRAIVADFGVARAIAAVDAERLTGSGIAVGTTPYMSPEQAAGAALDGRSDVYALACVVYEMLAGEPPFTGPTPQAVLAKHMQAPVPDVRVIRSTVGLETQHVLATALAKSPADRYASAGEFVAALQASLSSASARIRRQRLAIVGTAALVIPAAALLVGRLLGGPPDHVSTTASDPDLPRVAVLYFEDLTPDSSLRHIADGLTDELIFELSGVNAFRVVSKGGVRQFRDRRAPFDSVVRVLGASTVVDGSLQRAGEDIRVMVQLIDARTSTNVDRIALQRPVGEFLSLQNDVAHQVATALRRRMGREVARRREVTGTNNSHAAELVLKARRAREDATALASHPHPEDRKATLETLDRADSLLAQAQQEDPEWVRPVLDRGWVAHQKVRLLRGRERTEVGELGLRHALEAVRRAPGSAEALELRGSLRWLLARDLDTSTLQARRFREAETDLRAALDQDSSRASAWGTLSWVLLRLGKFAEADLAAERALREDAYLSDARDIYERAFYSAVWNGDTERAWDWCRRGQLSFPGYWRFLECELTLLREDVDARPDEGRAWRIVAELERVYTRDQARVDGNPYNPIYWRMVAAALSARAGQHDLARTEIVRARRATAGDSVLRLDLAYDEAYLRLVLGERGRADSLLRFLIEARPGTRALLARDPLFRDLELEWLRVSP